MGFFDTVFAARTKKVEATPEASPMDIREAEIAQLQRERLELRESNGMMALRLEDYMWSPIAGWQQNDGFSLQTIKDEADHCRALYAVNPLIKKAVSARVGFIHGRGSRVISADGSNTNKDRIEKLLDTNSRRIFGRVAQARLEAELSTAGNVWVLQDSPTKSSIIVPINHIRGYITKVDDPTAVLYWQRSYSTTQTDVKTGSTSTVEVSEYIPAFDNTNPEVKIGETPVRRGSKMFHISANRQEGWVLGLPDVFAAKFWARGHKEMFEAGHEFALAQGQYAAKVTGGSGMGSQLAAARLADEPRRDPDTGEMYGIGGTAFMSNGMDLQLMGKMGSGVDFKSYDRITSLIAAATGVPVAVLLAESDSDEVSLEQSVVEDMKLRQEVWGEFYEDFFGSLDVQVVWPRIKQETLYRVQQAVEIANRTNTLKGDEKRLLALESFGLEGRADDVPDISEHPDVLVYRAKKELDLEFAPKIAEATAAATPEADDDEDRSTVPDQGNDQGVGKLSDGSDSHDSRDRGEQEHTR